MFDSHAHYDDVLFDPDRETLLDELFSSGVRGIINAGTNKTTSLFSLSLSEKYKNMFFTAGVHPEHAPDCAGFEDWLLPLLSKEKCVAGGEIGLDYHYDTPKEPQKNVFIKQLETAKGLGKPVVIHCRDAHQDCLDILRGFSGVRGVMHSFAGSPEMAELLLGMGFYISFSGVVTFKNAKKSKAVAETTPLSRLLCETDSPYLTPHPFRGRRNNSAFLEYTLKQIAEVKNVGFEELKQITFDNAKELFSLPADL